MPRHQPGKRFIGIILRVLPQQHAIIHWLHLPISVSRPARTDNLFARRVKLFEAVDEMNACRFVRIIIAHTYLLPIGLRPLHRRL